MRELQELTRKNIWALTPYSCARDEFKGRAASIFLDANENPYNTPLNRYPDPLQEELKAKLAAVKGVRPERIFLGNGSDEAIDLVYRVFCEPRQDNVVAISPTYGMYGVCADVNDVEYRSVKRLVGRYRRAYENHLALLAQQPDGQCLRAPTDRACADGVRRHRCRGRGL